MNSGMNKQMNEQMNEQINERMYEWMNKCINEWRFLKRWNIHVGKKLFLFYVFLLPYDNIFYQTAIPQCPIFQISEPMCNVQCGRYAIDPVLCKVTLLKIFTCILSLKYSVFFSSGHHNGWWCRCTHWRPMCHFDSFLDVEGMRDRSTVDKSWKMWDRYLGRLVFLRSKQRAAQLS